MSPMSQAYVAHSSSSDTSPFIPDLRQQLFRARHVPARQQRLDLVARHVLGQLAGLIACTGHSIACCPVPWTAGQTPS
jgi:hypothetical protein